MDVQMRRGMLETCVLSVLLNKESYGYQMIKEISPILNISESTLYPILKRLESEGYLSVRLDEHNGRLRKYYFITSTGIEKVKKFRNEWSETIKVYDFIENMWGEHKNEKK